MKKVWAIILLLMVLLLPTTPVFAQQGGGGGRIIFGEDFILRAGETLDDSLVVFGGNVVLEKGSTVKGDVAVFGGNVQAAGAIHGDMAVIGGNVDLPGTAVIDGDLLNLGGHVTRAKGATVRGKLQELTPGLGREGPSVVPVPPRPPLLPDLGYVSGDDGGGVLTLIWRTFKAIVRAVVWMLTLMALGLLAVLFLPANINMIAQGIVQEPLRSFGIGLLTLIVGGILGLFLLIAACSGLLVWLALALATLFGWIAAGCLVGQRLLEALNVKGWTQLGATVLGVGLITLVSQAPCLGLLFGLVVSSFGLGAVILTGLGTHPYAPSSPLPPVAPPAP
jgi:hypothetical protein